MLQPFHLPPGVSLVLAAGDGVQRVRTDNITLLRWLCSWRVCQWVPRVTAALIAGMILLVGGKAAAESVVIGVIGDFGAAVTGATAASNELAVANLVKRWNPGFIFTTGDNNYPSGAASTIDANIGQFYHEFIHPYAGAYGSGAATNRFFPCLGNHDWVSNGQPHSDYFALPGNERYYNYRHGPVEIFAVNSNADPDGTTTNSVQGRWLRDQLAVSTAAWKLVYFHHSPYGASAGGEAATGMRWPFAAWGATAVFTGHQHHYARIHTNRHGRTRVQPAACAGVRLPGSPVRWRPR